MPPQHATWTSTSKRSKTHFSVQPMASNIWLQVAKDIGTCSQKTKWQAVTFLRARGGTLSSVRVACCHNNIKFAYWKRCRSGQPPSHFRLKVTEEMTTQAPPLRLCASQSFTDNRQLAVASFRKRQRSGGSTCVIAEKRDACPPDVHGGDAAKKPKPQPTHRQATLPVPAP